MCWVNYPNYSNNNNDNDDGDNNFNDDSNHLNNHNHFNDSNKCILIVSPDTSNRLSVIILISLSISAIGWPLFAYCVKMSAGWQWFALSLAISCLASLFCILSIVMKIIISLVYKNNRSDYVVI